MARTYRKNEKYATFPGDGSRKGLQRMVNKRFRAATRHDLRFGDELPVVKRQVDRLHH